MSESPINPKHAQPDSTNPASPKPKKKRRWLKVLGGVLLFVVVLIVLIPTIASTGIVRNFVLGKVNESLNGKLAINDWSIGWASGVKATGVRVEDEKGDVIFDGEASTQLSLIKAATGTFDLGETNLKGKFLIKIDKEGHSNVEKLPKTTTPAPKPTPPSTDPLKVPNVTGKFLAQVDGRVEQEGSPTIYVQTAKIDATITDINQPISPNGLIEIKVGENGQVGTVKLSGTADAFENNTLNLDKLATDLKLEIAGIDLSAANPFLAAAQAVLTGVANGSINLKTDGISKPSADGLITVTNLSASGAAFKGDTLVLGTLSIPLKVTATMGDNGATVVKIDKFRAEIPQGFVDVAGQITQKTIERLTKNLSPDDDGWISATVAVNDFVSITKQLPHMLLLQDGVAVTGGKFSKVTNVTFRKNDIVSKTRIDLQAAGTNGGQAIAIAPVSVSIDATYLPGADVLKGLRDMALVVNSDFATVAGGGASLGKIDLNGNFDLAKLRAQLAQFVDLKDLQLAGAGNFAIASVGDVANVSDVVKTSANVSVTGLNLSLPKQPPLKLEKLSLKSNADLSPGTATLFSAVRSAGITFQTFEGGQPIIDVVGSATGVDLQTFSVQKFDLSKLAITDLAKVQTMVDGFIPASLKDKGIRVAAGQIYTNVSGSYDGKTRTVTLDKPLELSTPNLTVQANDAAGNPTDLLNKEKFNVAFQGSATMPLDGSISAKVSTLSVMSSSKLVSVTKNDGDFVFKQSAKGAFSGTGAINIAANLKQLNDIAQVFMTKSEGAGQLTSGNLSAILALTHADKPETALAMTGDVKNLSVTTSDPKNPIDNESISFAVNAISPDDLSGIRNLAASLKGTWLTAALTNGQLNLNGGIWDMLQSIDIAVTSSDLSRVQQVANAFAGAQQIQAKIAPKKPKKGEAATPKGGAPVPPMFVQSGQLDLKASVARDKAASITRVSVPTIKISSLSLKRGDKLFAFDQATPLNIRFAAEVNAIDDPTGKIAVTDQIKSIRITELTGDLQIANLSMPQPITLTNLATSPSANGAFAFNTTMEAATPLLAVLMGGDELPYGGKVSLMQVLTNAGDDVKLLGTIAIDDFKVLDAADRKKVAFTEKQIAIKNDLSANLKSSNASINSLTVDMPQSKAVGVAVTGGVKDWLVARELQNFKLDFSYDLEKIWPIVKPMLAPETQETLKDLKVAGKYTKRFNLTGSYPAQNAKGEALAFYQSIKTINGDGGFTIDLLDAAGLKIEKFDIPLLITAGKAAILNADKSRPAVATCNGGTIDIGEITVDLTADEPRAWTAKNQKLLHNVTINPLLGDTLGKYVNPVFANAERASGLLDVTIEYCKGVGIISKWQTPESGSARIVFSLSDMDIANPMGSLLLGKLSGVAAIGNISKNQADTFKGQIKDAVVTLDKGETKQDVTLSLTAVEPAAVANGQPRSVVLPLTFKGDIRLSDLKQNLAVNVPTALLVGIGKETDVRKVFNTVFPSGIPVTMTGTTLAPQVDVGNFAQKMAEGLLTTKGGDLIGDLLNGGKKKNDNTDDAADKPKKKKK